MGLVKAGPRQGDVGHTCAPAQHPGFWKKLSSSIPALQLCGPQTASWKLTLSVPDLPILRRLVQLEFRWQGTRGSQQPSFCSASTEISPVEFEHTLFVKISTSHYAHTEMQKLPRKGPPLTKRCHWRKGRQLQRKASLTNILFRDAK